MARKRGGLAGFWDEHKGAIKTIAPMAAGLIPGVGPLVSAGLGAAMGGLDRPGQHGLSGFGLKDLGNTLKGGVSGYGAGMAGAGIGGGVKGLLTGAKEGIGSALSGGFEGAKGAMGTYNQEGLGRLMSGGGSAAGSPTSPLPSDVPGMAGVGNPPLVGVGANTGFTVPNPSNMSKVASMFTGKNAPVGAAAISGISNALAGGQRAGIEQRSADLQQSMFDYKKEQDERERKNKEAITRLLMPFYQDAMSKYQNYKPYTAGASA